MPVAKSNVRPPQKTEEAPEALELPDVRSEAAPFHADAGLLFLRMLWFTLYFCLGSYVFYLEIFNYKQYPSDFGVHMLSIWNFQDPNLHIAHPLFHFLSFYVSRIVPIGIGYSAVFVTAVFLTATSVLINLILTRTLKERFSGGFILFLTVLLAWVHSIYIPFLCKFPCLGQSGPNLWHTPTTIVVKPLALACFFGVVGLIEDRRLQRNTWAMILAAAMCLLSTLAKPNFVMAFFPAVGIYLLIRHTRRFDLYWKTGLIFLPTMLLILYQFLSTFSLGGGPSTRERDRIFFDFLGVWRLYVRNVPVSIMLGTAFPLSVLAFRFRNSLRDPFQLLGWIMMLVALAQACTLAEEIKYRDMNFGWGYTISLTIVFVNAAVELFRWMAEPGRRGVRAILGMAFCSIVFAFHVASGIYYFGRIIAGLGYS